MTELTEQTSIWALLDGSGETPLIEGAVVAFHCGPYFQRSISLLRIGEPAEVGSLILNFDQRKANVFSLFFPTVEFRCEVFQSQDDPAFRVPLNHTHLGEHQLIVFHHSKRTEHAVASGNTPHFVTLPAESRSGPGTLQKFELKEFRSCRLDPRIQEAGLEAITYAEQVAPKGYVR